VFEANAFWPLRGCVCLLTALRVKAHTHTHTQTGTLTHTHTRTTYHVVCAKFIVIEIQLQN